MPRQAEMNRLAPLTELEARREANRRKSSHRAKIFEERAPYQERKVGLTVGRVSRAEPRKTGPGASLRHGHAGPAGQLVTAPAPRRVLVVALLAFLTTL